MRTTSTNKTTWSATDGSNAARFATRRKIMKNCRPELLLACLPLLLIVPAHGAEDVETAQLATRVCANCHGPRGASVSSAFPNLAGQQAAYIEAQLKSFKDKTRGDPYAQAYMWGMASQLDDETIKRLAAYYAAQKPSPARKADAATMATGKQIFEHGLPEAEVPACNLCHGENAHGKDAIPRLAGQHPEYLVKQLVAFKSLQRANNPVMHSVTNKMSLEQIQAVAGYAAAK
jgi:cytochrome c553